MADAGAAQVKPLVPESSTSESTNVEVVMNDLRDKTLTIPDYQRDGDQWDDVTKALFVESVINNLTVPAFFFEVRIGEEDGVERNEVVDGQQRLATLEAFFKNKFRMVNSEEAPYLTPNSVHYAGKTFDELPPAFQQAFKKYRLTIIKLRQLKDTRLEVFRRINQGGTPLSGQDIRLAYYGSESKTVTFVRIAGVFDPERPASKRFIEGAQAKFGFGYPWTDEVGADTWTDWWQEKEIARGQAASEMFLWALLGARVKPFDQLLNNQAALAKIGSRWNRAVDEALDIYCAQAAYQDNHPAEPALVMDFDEVSKKFFPHFQRWVAKLLGEKGVNLPVSKNRVIAALIGAAYAVGVPADKVPDAKWATIVELARRPQEVCKGLGIDWPASKGKWDGTKGYKVQLEAMETAVTKVMK